MAILYIPLAPGNPNYRMSVAIDNALYYFDFRWNERDSAWFLDVRDYTLKPIWCGIKCVIGIYLGRVCNQSPFLEGALICFDSEGKSRDATFDDFGTRVRMAYVPANDLLVLYQKLGIK